MTRRGLIVGAGSGIGKGIYESLMNAERPEEGYGIQWYRPDHLDLDVSQYQSVNDWFGHHHGWETDPEFIEEPFDYVVFSAGVNYLEWLGKLDAQKTVEVIDVNLLGFIWVLDALQRTQPNHPTRIVVIGSDAAERPLRTSIGYCASKAGLHQAVRVAARELGPKGWRVNVVAPGMTDETGMQEYVDTRVAEVRGWSREHMLAYEATQEVVPGRMSVQEVAHIAIDTLFGPDHLNGSIITINGGR